MWTAALMHARIIRDPGGHTPPDPLYQKIKYSNDQSRASTHCADMSVGVLKVAADAAISRC